MPSPTPNRVYVGVNLLTGEVVAVARYAETIASGEAYVITGTIDESTITDATTTIVLDQPRGWESNEAVRYCLASQGCGLGWSFRVAS